MLALITSDMCVGSRHGWLGRGRDAGDVHVHQVRCPAGTADQSSPFQYQRVCLCVCVCVCCVLCCAVLVCACVRAVCVLCV